MRKILIRFDDICPTMDYKQFQKALDVMRQYNVKPLLGVIPDCHDDELLIEDAHDDFWEYIKGLRDEGYTLAMHGYNHVYDIKCRGNVNMGYKSEFAGHTYEEQLKKIKAGKNILIKRGIETDIFFAPSHSYDDNTIKALADCGFKYISDGLSHRPINRYGVLCIPCRSGGVPKIKRKGYYTAVFHAHEWARLDKAQGYNQLVKLCENYADDIVDFNTYNDRVGSTKTCDRIDEWIYVRFQRYVRPILSKIKHGLLRTINKDESE
jgi:predicted deacetylase